MTRRKCSRCRRTMSARHFRDLTETAASAAVRHKRCSHCRRAPVGRTDSDEEAWTSAISTPTTPATPAAAAADSKQCSRCRTFRPLSLFTAGSREYKTCSACRRQPSVQPSPQYLPRGADSQDSPNVAVARAQIINIQRDHRSGESKILLAAASSHLVCSIDMPYSLKRRARHRHHQSALIYRQCHRHSCPLLPQFLQPEIWTATTACHGTTILRTQTIRMAACQSQTTIPRT
jgi:hypothetical protein